MAYKIGSVDVKATWNLSGSIHGDKYQVDPQTGGSAGVAFSVSCGPLSVAGDANISGTTDDDPADAGQGTIHLGDKTHGFTGIFTLDLGGNVVIVAPCDLCWEYVGQGGSNPFCNGVVDSPFYRTRRYFLVGNGTATLSASFAGLDYSSSLDIRGVEISASASASGRVGSGPSTYPLTGTLEGVNHGNAGFGIALASITVPPDGSVAPAMASYSYTVRRFKPDGSPDGSVVINASSSGVYAGGSVTLAASDGGSATAGGNWSAARSWGILGVIRAMEAAYPDSLTLTDAAGTFTAAGGTFGRNGTQHNYSLSTHADATSAVNDDHSSALNTFTTPTFAAPTIEQDSLIANGDEPATGRILLHGRTADGLTIAQATSYAFDDMV